MKTAAIIPVKTFSKAKTRLKINENKKEKLCKLMLEEVLKTVSASKTVNKIIVVSKDEDALSLGKKFDSVQIFDDNELGVNQAVSLADEFLKNSDFDTSVVFPQDLPFMEPMDVDYLLNFQNMGTFVKVVPSRKFDGTNALVRKPIDIIQTHYDEDSYKIHLSTGKSKTKNTSLILLRRIMLDIDTPDDLVYIQKLHEKSIIRNKIQNLL